MRPREKKPPAPPPAGLASPEPGPEIEVAAVALPAPPAAPEGEETVRPPGRYLSHSQLSMLARCGVQWEFRYVKKVRMRPSVALHVGRAVDDATAANLRAKMEAGQLLDLGAVQELAHNSLVTGWEKDGVELDEDEVELGLSQVRGKAIDKAVRLTALHHRDAAPSIRPTGVQVRWEIEVPGYTTLVGITDVEEGVAAIRDTKTSGRSPSVKGLEVLGRGRYRGGDADLSGQLTIYALAVRARTGRFPGKLTLDVLVDKKTPELVILETTRGREDLQPLLGRLEAALKTIEAGIFMPADPAAPASPCGWCGYRSICPYVRRGAAVAT